MNLKNRERFRHRRSTDHSYTANRPSFQGLHLTGSGSHTVFMYRLKSHDAIILYKVAFNIHAWHISWVLERYLHCRHLIATCELSLLLHLQFGLFRRPVDDSHCCALWFISASSWWQSLLCKMVYFGVQMMTVTAVHFGLFRRPDDDHWQFLHVTEIILFYHWLFAAMHGILSK